MHQSAAVPVQPSRNSAWDNMRSSSGVHFIALDHVRALAAFMVFAWHFTHGPNGYPVPFDYVPALFPFSLLDEGHTGVALFMTLSGYLFAKLLDGKSINYPAFLWNRILRLFPLLVVVILIVGIEVFLIGGSISSYFYLIAKGALFPTLPNGAWSITVEFHYYLILPLFLWMLRKSKLLPISIIIAAIALRFFIHHERGEVQSLAFRYNCGPNRSVRSRYACISIPLLLLQPSCSCNCYNHWIRYVLLVF